MFEMYCCIPGCTVGIHVMHKDSFRALDMTHDCLLPCVQAALHAFKNGTAQVLVATDVAGRGLHIKMLPYVVNYDFPSRMEAYIHRVGRTGRLASSGHAFSFFTRNLAPLARPLLNHLLVRSACSSSAHQTCPTSSSVTPFCAWKPTTIEWFAQAASCPAAMISAFSRGTWHPLLGCFYVASWYDCLRLPYDYTQICYIAVSTFTAFNGELAGCADHYAGSKLTSKVSCAE